MFYLTTHSTHFIYGYMASVLYGKRDTKLLMTVTLSCCCLYVCLGLFVVCFVLGWVFFGGVHLLFFFLLLFYCGSYVGGFRVFFVCLFFGFFSFLLLFLLWGFCFVCLVGWLVFGVCLFCFVAMFSFFFVSDVDRSSF